MSATLPIPDDQYVIYVRDYADAWDPARYARIMACGYVREAARLRGIGELWALKTARSTLTRASCWRAEAQRVAALPEHVQRGISRGDLEWFVHTRWADTQRVYL